MNMAQIHFADSLWTWTSATINWKYDYESFIDKIFTYRNQNDNVSDSTMIAWICYRVSLGRLRRPSTDVMGEAQKYDSVKKDYRAPSNWVYSVQESLRVKHGIQVHLFKGEANPNIKAR